MSKRYLKGLFQHSAEPAHW